MDTILSNTKRYFKNKKENKIILEKNFKIKHSFEKRFEESKNILEKYPNRIPIICERLTTEIPDIDRSKYLCQMIYLSQILCMLYVKELSYRLKNLFTYL